MKKTRKLLSLCLGLVLALGVTACNEISDLVDEGAGSEDTTESDTGSEDGGDTTGDGGEQEKDKVLVTSLTFNASSYLVEVGGSTPYSVSVEPSDATNQDYSISFYSVETHVVTTDIATTDEAGTSIVGLSAGECYIVATALDGSGVYGYASVTVNAKETPIERLILSQDEITVDAGASFTISSVVGSDVVVTPDPVNADNPAWTIKEDGTSYLTVSTRGTDNSYTVEASEEGAGSTASLVLTAEADSEVTATLTVHISEVVADTHPVTGITLTKDGTSISELTLTTGEELTIGAVGSDADIIVEVSPDNADEVGFTVSSDNSDVVTISEPDNDTGIVTVTALDNTSWTADKEATITVTTVGKDASGSTLSATLKVIVPRPEEHVNSLEVTPKSISLVTNEEILLTSLDGFSVTIYNQYNEVMNGVDWTASVTSGESYLTLTGSTSTDYTIKAVSEGSATITITASGTQISDTIAVSITDKVYDVTSIEMDANQYDLGYGLGGETSDEYPASIDLAQHVKYINNEADDGLASSSQYGVTAAITTNTDDAITLSGTVVTAIGVGSATVTLTSTTNTEASVVANIVVTDITDYTPTGITCTTTAFTVSNGSTTTLSDVITGVSVVPAYASQEYVVMVDSGSESYLSISEGVLSATNTTNSDVEATLLVYPLYNNEAYTSVTPATITVTVKTDYVAVTSVTITPTTLTLTEGESETVSISEIVPSNATNANSVSWNSSNTSAATVDNNGVVTALSADHGTADITATVDGIVSNACTVTVEAANKAVTVEFKIISSDGYTQLKVPDTWTAYLVGSFNMSGSDWVLDNSYILKEIAGDNGTYTYQYTFEDGLAVGEYSYQIIVEQPDDEESWDNKINDDGTFSVTSDDIGGNPISVTCNSKYNTLEDLYAELTDENSYTIRIALKNTGNSSSKAFAIEGDSPFEWCDFDGVGIMTTTSGDYDRYYDVRILKGTDLEFYISTSSAGWDRTLQGAESLEWNYYTTHAWDYEGKLGITTVDEWADDWSSYSMITVIFSFNFESFNETSSPASYNKLITAVSVTHS